MARIQDLLDGNLVIDDLAATDKPGVIREFADLIASRGNVRDREALVRVILEREAQGSTGIGDGIAIPHAKSSEISGMIVAFGRSGRGIDFQSLDGKPAHLFFLLLTPENQPSEHLKTLARISRIMRSAELRERLKACGSKQEILSLIVEEDSKYANSR